MDFRGRVYFGEILLWTGIAVIALPELQGGQHITLISPVFVAFLLTKVSGVRMLEARASKQWGNDPDYQAYLKNTPALVPRPPRVMQSDGRLEQLVGPSPHSNAGPAPRA